MRSVKGIFSLLCLFMLLCEAGNASDTWKTLLARADSLCKAVKYDSAVVVGSAALDQARTAYGPEDTTVALVLHRLGVYEWYRGEYTRAESLTTAALQIREHELGPEHMDVARSLNNLAMIHESQGRFAEASPDYLRALAISEKVLGPEHPNVAITLNNLGHLSLITGRYTEAETLYKRALAISEKVLGPEHPNVAIILDNLGQLSYITGRYTEAETLYKRALAISEKVLGPEHPNVAKGLHRLSEAEITLNRLTVADSLARKSLAIYERALGPGWYRSAWPLARLGAIHVLKREFAQAEPYYQRSLELVEKALSPEQTEVLLSLDALGRLYYLEGKFAVAESLFQRECDDAQKAFARNGSGMSEHDALLYSSSMKCANNGFLSSVIRSKRSVHDLTTPEANAMLTGKGQVSDEILERQRSAVQETDSATLALAEASRYARFQLSELFASGPDSDIVAYRKQVDSLGAAANDLERKLAQRSSSYRRNRDYKDVTEQRVASLLPAKSALIEYIKFDYLQLEPDSSIPHYLALVIRGRHAPQMFDLGVAASIDRLVTSYRRHMQQIATAGRIPSSLELSDYKKLGGELYAKVWKPLEKLLPKDHQLFIAGDGALNLISFAGLPTPEGQYLVEDYPLQYLSSGRDLIRFEDKAESAHGLLALGDPDFDASPSARLSGAEMATQSDTAVVAYAMRNVRSGCGTLSETKVEPLPGTRTEVQQLVSQWRAVSSEPIAAYFGSQASEDNLRKYAPESRILHLATHGYFLEGACQPSVPIGRRGAGNDFVGENPLLLSGLLFAGANLHGAGADKAGVDDGILSAYEVSGLNLRGTETVVLSACETGLGEVKTGEGVYGLRRAFQVAGARTVVSALWPVADITTAEMMGHLYSSSDQPLIMRLRQMQLDQIAKLRSAGLPDHPFLWAAFVATGDWR